MFASTSSFKFLELDLQTNANLEIMARSPSLFLTKLYSISQILLPVYHYCNNKDSLFIVNRAINCHDRQLIYIYLQLTKDKLISRNRTITIDYNHLKIKKSMWKNSRTNDC